jgi:hypothetical protein
MKRPVSGGLILSAVLCLTIFASPVYAAAVSPAQIEQILQRLDVLEKENAALKERLYSLESENAVPSQAQEVSPVTSPSMAETNEAGKALDTAVADLPVSPMRSPAKELAGIDLGKSARLRLLDLSLDVLTVVGASTEQDASLETLQGGGHDPKRRGFTLQQAELSLIGEVDPYFRAEGHIIASEDEIELEEAFIQTTSLPWGLEVEAGYFLTEFGRINPSHPHAWKWLDQPVINTRLFGGEGMRGTGLRLSKILPVSWYSVLHVGAQNADGEFMASFLGGEISHDHGEEASEHADELTIGGRPLVEQDTRNLGDLVYLLRWENSGNLSPTWTGKFGLSALYGPNATGPDGNTWIYGADWLFKWVPASNQKGRPFFTVEGEVSKRDYRADAFYEADEDEWIDKTTLEDWGGYLQALYGFPNRWSAGLRIEYASGSGSNQEHEGAYPARDDDPFRDDRLRISPLVMFSLTEFSRLRLQYNYDDADHLTNPAHSVWLGLEVMIGAHPAHSF